MTIGELLKEKRLAENKTQKEWAGNIISTSYYAKVEKNQHRIAAEDLLALLKHNDISTTDFFKELEDKKDDFHKELNSLTKISIDAVYHSDIGRIKEVIRTIEKLDVPLKQKEAFILVHKGFIELVKEDLNDNYQPDKNVIRALKDKIFSIPNFTRFKLELYTNFMTFYDYKTNIMLTNQIIHKIDQFNNDKELLAITGILSNLLSQLLEEKHYKEALPFLKIADKLPAIPDLYLPKTYIALQKYLIDYHFNKKQEDLDKAKTIIKTYQITGLEDFGKSAQKFIDKAKKD